MSELAKNIKNLMEQKNMSALKLSEAAGMKRDFIYTILRGGSKRPNYLALHRVADALGVTVADLDPDLAAMVPSGDMPAGHVAIPLVGTVQAGPPREAWKPAQDAETIVIPKPSPASEHYAVTVAGDSMSVIYPAGTTLICAPVNEFGGDATSDGRAVIIRRSVSGLVEYSVKTIRQAPDGGLWLTPQSTNPVHSAIFLAAPGASPDPDVSIIGVVVQALVSYG